MNYTVVEIDAAGSQIWRGARSSGDMMARKGALTIRNGGARVEIVGTPDELDDLLVELTTALTAQEW